MPLRAAFVAPEARGILALVGAEVRHLVTAAIRDPRTWRINAAGIRVAPEIRPVLPLVAISGADCVEALVLGGFTVRSRSDSATILERGLRVVVVPDVAMLAPEDMETLLRDAGLAYDDLLDLVSESPTDPDVMRPTSGIRPLRTM
jgi:hypothetical protein